MVLSLQSFNWCCCCDLCGMINKLMMLLFRFSYDCYLVDSLWAIQTQSVYFKGVVSLCQCHQRSWTQWSFQNHHHSCNNPRYQYHKQSLFNWHHHYHQHLTSEKDFFIIFLYKKSGIYDCPNLATEMLNFKNYWSQSIKVRNNKKCKTQLSTKEGIKNISKHKYRNFLQSPFTEAPPLGPRLESAPPRISNCVQFQGGRRRENELKWNRVSSFFQGGNTRLFTQLQQGLGSECKARDR